MHSPVDRDLSSGWTTGAWTEKSDLSPMRFTLLCYEVSIAVNHIYVSGCVWFQGQMG